jgi:hypothetical protein
MNDMVVRFVITEERYERFRCMALEMIELCQKNCTPGEAYIVFEICLRGLEEQYGFKGSTVVTKEELEKSW